MTVDWLSHLWNLWGNELRGIVRWPEGTWAAAVAFVNFFPVLLSLIWSVSALLAMIVKRFVPRRSSERARQLPSFSVLIPFYGNLKAARRTARSLWNLVPAPEEIILIDDGSPDPTPNADSLDLPPNTRILRLGRNLGKAGALNRSLQSVDSEIIVCLDSDTIAETKDWSHMLSHFAENAGTGAVTGKIWPAKIGSIAQLIQAVDYLVVICMVKCAESLWGGVMTVSGAWVAYRRCALVECGGWNPHTSAEDIDLSWRFQASGWRISYAMDWTARVEMAPAWGSLWRQRRRWSSGLGRTVREQWSGIFLHESRHVPVAFITLLSAVWMWACVALMAIALLRFATHPGSWRLGEMLIIWPHANWPLYTKAFTFQLLVAIFIDRGAWRRYPALLLIAPCYPAYFWFILLTSYCVGFPQGFFRRDAGKWKPTAFAGGGTEV